MISLNKVTLVENFISLCLDDSNIAESKIYVILLERSLFYDIRPLCLTNRYESLQRSEKACKIKYYL